MYSYIIAWKISPSIILDNSRKRKRIYTRGEEIANNRSREIPREADGRNTIRFCIRFCRGLNCGDKLEEKSWNTSRASRDELKARDEIERRIVRLSRPNGSPAPTYGPFSPLLPLSWCRETLDTGGEKNPSSRRDIKSEAWHASLEGFFLDAYVTFRGDNYSSIIN